MKDKPSQQEYEYGNQFTMKAYLDEKSARHRERMLKHDGRIRRYLMERVKESVKNHLVAGEAPN